MAGRKAQGKHVYLDHAASTPMHAAAVEAVQHYMGAEYANPSGSHALARSARRVIDESRDIVAEIIGCAPGEVVFTSGGTEGANAAVLGAVRRGNGRAVCPAAEHHAVLHCVEDTGGTVVPVLPDATVDLDALASELSRGGAAVVSVMAVNNEVGSMNDMERVARVVRGSAPGAVLHTDAVQAACWTDLRELWRHVDVLTLSAHKFGGPKGAGVMVIREGTGLAPLILGGGQERDRRSGTLNVPGVVGTAVALAVTNSNREEEVARLDALRRRLVDAVTSRVGCATATVPHAKSVPGVAHICFEGLESESLLFLLDEEGVCVSAASACASGAMEPSHVLAAMGVPRSRMMGSVRFSLGHTTTTEDIDAAVDAAVGAAERLVAARS
ncbi:MAG: cysteine desulfurase family protein [Ilumatobacteraceae bacterium]|jgi:cysteine desulfurase